MRNVPLNTYRTNLPWEASRFGGQPVTLGLIGAACLALYAFTKITLPDLAGLVEPVLLLASLVGFFAYGGTLRKSLPVWLLAAAIAVPHITWASAYWTIPEWADSSPGGEYLARHFTFIFIAWWLGGSPRNVILLWALASAGLLLAPWTVGGGLGELLAGLQGKRIDLGIRNAQHTALLFGAMLLGLIVFWKRIVFSGRYRILRVLTLVALLFFSLLVVLASQTRAVVLAYLVVLPLLAGILLYTRLHGQQRSVATGHPAGGRRFLRPVALALSLLLAVAAGYYILSYTSQRMESEQDVIAQLARGDVDSLRYSSIGIRVNSWRAAMDWIAERPLLGWGANGSKLVHQHTEWLKVYTGGQFGHMHNSYIEMLVRYGFAALTLYLVLTVWLVNNLFKAWRAGFVHNDLFAFYLSFLLYWSIVNVFESFIFFSTGIFLFNLILAGLTTQIWLYKTSQHRLSESGLVSAQSQNSLYAATT